MPASPAQKKGSDESAAPQEVRDGGGGGEPGRVDLSRRIKGALQPKVNSIGRIKLAHVHERVFFITVELPFTSLSPLKSILPV